ncbi:MAG: LysM peptidoglycan-binding domain-containing protein [Spirochaetaceae bacterium]|nr:LysM peptidoglycan-binding domain-containing protein [Spirochaetaceae bacterium]
MKRFFLPLVALGLFFTSCASSSPAPVAPETDATAVQSAAEETTTVVQEDANKVTEEAKVVTEDLKDATEEAAQVIDEGYDYVTKILISYGAKKHGVQYRDTLTNIAKKYYGKDNGYYFPLIMLASRQDIADPDKIEPGMDFIVPDLQKCLDNKLIHKSLSNYFKEVADIYATKKTTTAKKTHAELFKIAESF